MISFIMMAKNEEERIGDAISSLITQSVYEKWELIIVDDGSTDKTFEVASHFSLREPRVKVFRNIHLGKVLGTGYGYTLSKGEYIKCIDADDVLLPEFFYEFKKAIPFDAHCHSALVTNEKLDPIAFYAVNLSILNSNYNHVVENLLSLPKWSWTFHRTVADKLFPIPTDMPIEDVWMSIVIRSSAKQIKFNTKPLYLYRQHHGQDYGGILNFDRDMVVLRALRSEKIIQVLENEYPELLTSANLDPMKKALQLQTCQKSIFTILASGIPAKLMIKVLVMLHFPAMAKILTKLKWKHDGFKI